jgi:Na+-transporting methylmalonyl-CoA/oxaloacetate decarboxylase gamma subunit
MSISQSLIVGLFCMAVVFSMLLLLFVSVSIMGRVLRAAKKPEPISNALKGGKSQ